jgi:hypothetical protein
MQLDDGRRDFGPESGDGGRMITLGLSTNYREAAFRVAELAAWQLIE